MKNKRIDGFLILLIAFSLYSCEWQSKKNASIVSSTDKNVAVTCDVEGNIRQKNMACLQRFFHTVQHG